MSITNALKQAREALTTGNIEQGMKAIEVIDSAISQKPAAFMYERENSDTNVHLEHIADAESRGWKETPLYTLPPSAEQAAEKMRTAMLEYLVDAEIVEKESSVYRTLANQPLELILV